MKNLLLLFLLIACSLSSCKKEDEVETQPIATTEEPDDTSASEENDTTTTNEENDTTEEDNDEVEENPVEEDIIKIVSATPSSTIIDGETVEFTVVVDYDLVSLEKGEIGIGFNNGSNSIGAIMLDMDEYVDKGDGQHTFIASTTVKDWGPEEDFIVFVKLSEADHTPNEPHFPVASDKYILIPKD